TRTTWSPASTAASSTRCSRTPGPATSRSPSAPTTRASRRADRSTSRGEGPARGRAPAHRPRCALRTQREHVKFEAVGEPRIRWRTAAVTGAATVLAGSSAGTASWAAYRYLMAQAGVARGVIGRDTSKPPEADGIYLPGAVRPEPWRLDRHADLHLMIFGDSTAAGVGCTDATEVPGVRLARGLAEATGRSIRLSTKAISGATSKGLSGQVDAMFVAGPPPDAAVILIGGNDITKKHSVGRSAGRLKRAVAG